jgi:hypothetical protein
MNDYNRYMAGRKMRVDCRKRTQRTQRERPFVLCALLCGDVRTLPDQCERVARHDERRKSAAFCCKVLHSPGRWRYKTVQSSRQEPGTRRQAGGPGSPAAAFSGYDGRSARLALRSPPSAPWCIRHPHGGNPKTILSPSYAIPMRFLCDSYAIPMRFLCDSYAIPMRFLCTSYADSMHFLCGFYALPMRILYSL